MKKYYAVECKCGHADSKKMCIYITFAVIADSKKEAAAIGRWIPRVKHNHKDAIRNVEEISYEEYLEIIKKNNDNPYLHCHSIQEQRELHIDYMFENDLYNHAREVTKAKPKEESNKKCYDSKTKIKYPKKYIKNHYLFSGDSTRIYDYQ